MRRYHHGSLKTDLVEKGLVLLHEQGVSGVSLRKVASMCGVSHTAPYKHFKSKDALLSAIYASSAHLQVSAPLESQYVPTDIRVRLVELGKRYISFCIEHPDYLSAASHAGHSVRFQKDGLLHYGAACPFRTCHDVASAYLRQEQPSRKDKSTWILGLWCMMHGVAASISAGCLECDVDGPVLAVRMMEGILDSQLKK
jgi:AcrR family transcriptional regulator